MAGFLSVLKASLLTIFIIAVLYFSYQGFHQVLDQQTSTRAEYRFGDDDNGNLELFDITICLGNQHSPAGLVKSGFNLSQILEHSKQKFNLSDEKQMIRFDIDAEANLTFSNLKGQEKNPWVPEWIHIVNWQSGHCYTFSPKSIGIATTSIKSHSVYDNSQVQTLLFLGAKFKHRTTLTLHVPGSIYSFAQNSGGNVFRIQQEM